jgi:hypothetical protein
MATPPPPRHAIVLTVCPDQCNLSVTGLCRFCSIIQLPCPPPRGALRAYNSHLLVCWALLEWLQNKLRRPGLNLSVQNDEALHKPGTNTGVKDAFATVDQHCTARQPALHVTSKVWGCVQAVFDQNVYLNPHDHRQMLHAYTTLQPCSPNPYPIQKKTINHSQRALLLQPHTSSQAARGIFQTKRPPPPSPPSYLDPLLSLQRALNPAIDDIPHERKAADPPPPRPLTASIAPTATRCQPRP